MATATAELRDWIQAQAGPDWLRAGRLAAALEAESLPLPRWDRTDVTRLDPQGLTPPVGGGVEFVLSEEARGQGVVCDTIENVAAARPDLVREHLGRVVPPSAGKFEARNAAAWQGCLLHVPAGVAVAEPVEITYRLPSAAGAQFHPRTVVALGRTAEVTVLQREEGGPDAGVGPALATSVVEADLADGAQLRFAEVQNWGQGVAAYAVRQAELARDARVRWLIGELGAGTCRSGTTSTLRGMGSEALALLVFFASAQQHMDLAATLRHHGARTNGEMLARGVLSGRARTIYRGTSDIERGAKDSNSQQKEKTLHLGEDVRSDAIPALYINENQLAAGHAATTGRVDEEQLFYMASRGVPRREAERLIVHGFFAPLLELIPLEAARAEIRRLVDRKVDENAGAAA